MGRAGGDDDAKYAKVFPAQENVRREDHLMRGSRTCISISHRNLALVGEKPVSRKNSSHQGAKMEVRTGEKKPLFGETR